MITLDAMDRDTRCAIMFTRGMTQAQIGRVIGLDRRTVGSILDRRTRYPRPGNEHDQDLRDLRIMKLLEQGKSPDTLAKRFDVDLAYVQRLNQDAVGASCVDCDKGDDHA